MGEKEDNEKHLKNVKIISKLRDSIDELVLDVNRFYNLNSAPQSTKYIEQLHIQKAARDANNRFGKSNEGIGKLND